MFLLRYHSSGFDPSQAAGLCSSDIMMASNPFPPRRPRSRVGQNCALSLGSRSAKGDGSGRRGVIREKDGCPHNRSPVQIMSVGASPVPRSAGGRRTKDVRGGAGRTVGKSVPPTGQRGTPGHRQWPTMIASVPRKGRADSTGATHEASTRYRTPLPKSSSPGCPRQDAPTIFFPGVSKAARSRPAHSRVRRRCVAAHPALIAPRAPPTIGRYPCARLARSGTGAPLPETVRRRSCRRCPRAA